MKVGRLHSQAISPQRLLSSDRLPNGHTTGVSKIEREKLRA